MSRPLMQSGINQLETLAREAAQRKSAFELLKVRDELRHRTTQRAADLLTYVEQELAACTVDSEPLQRRLDLSEAAAAHPPETAHRPDSVAPDKGGAKSADVPAGGSAVKGTVEVISEAGKRRVASPPATKGASVASDLGGVPTGPDVALMTPAEACRVLGVALTASWEHVERARRALVLPAVLKGEGMAHELAQQANAAYLSLARSRLL